MLGSPPWGLLLVLVDELIVDPSPSVVILLDGSFSQVTLDG